MIEVNEYVRTKNGEIGIFDRYSSRKENSLYKSPFNCFIKIKNRKTLLQCCEDYIVNHSKQLIDLIGCGDIVNRHFIIDKYEDVDEYGNDFWCLIIEDDSLLNRSIREENIQTILTKEIYMANCYKVGGEE